MMHSYLKPHDKSMDRIVAEENIYSLVPEEPDPSPSPPPPPPPPPPTPPADTPGPASPGAAPLVGPSPRVRSRLSWKRLTLAYVTVLALATIGMAMTYLSPWIFLYNRTGPKIAIFVSDRDTDVNASWWRQVMFTVTTVDLGEAYNQSSLTPPVGGLYLLALSVQSNNHVEYSLQGAPLSVGLYSGAAPGRQTTSRTLLLELPAGANLQVQCRGPPDSVLESSWAMASLSPALSPMFAFSVARNSHWRQAGKVEYQTVLVNRGGCYAETLSSFVAPMTGIYYFSVGAGIEANPETTRVQLKGNNGSLMELGNINGSHDGRHMISSALLVNLSRGERVHVELIEGAIHSSPEYKEVSFSGFLYEPAQGHKVAWSVWRSTPWSINGRIPFDVVRVNEGAVYNTSLHAVSVPVSGVYYLHVAAGLQSSARCYLDIMSDVPGEGGRWVSKWPWRHLPRHRGVDHTSHDLLLNLTQGQSVWLQVECILDYRKNFVLYSHENLVTGFSGFLLYT